jgi:hypothetical protein
VSIRVARWYIFKPKIPIWVNFGGVLQLKMLVYFVAIWSILQPFGVFCGYLVYFIAIWYILWIFGIFYGHFGSGSSGEHSRLEVLKSGVIM